MAQPEVSLATIRAAADALRGVVHRTPLLHAEHVGAAAGADVFLKAENLQRTGSFKIRGAHNRVRGLTAEQRRRGVITASAGNHAQGLALAAAETGVPATIVMPVGAPLIKVEATRSYGAEVVLAGADFDQAYEHAARLQTERGLTFVHAFDDPGVVAGQGTVALEILEDAPEVDTVLVPVGGGGLISGIAIALKALRPSVRVIGVQAAGAPSLYRSFRAGRLVDAPKVDTIADGLAVKQPRDLTFGFIRRYVDDILVVEEDEIAGALVTLLERSKLVAEGAGAVSVAALLYEKIDVQGETVVVVVSGGNIDINFVSRIIERGLVQSGRYTRLVVSIEDRPGALYELLGVVARAGANVVTVGHERLKPQVPLGGTDVQLTVETRNRHHADDLLEAIRAAGYQPGIIH